MPLWCSGDFLFSVLFYSTVTDWTLTNIKFTEKEISGEYPNFDKGKWCIFKI